MKSLLVDLTKNLSINKKVGLTILVTLTVTLNIMFYIFLSIEENSKKDKTQKSVLELSDAIKESISFAMNEGVVDVDPMVSRLEKFEDMLEVRIQSTNLIEDGAEATLDQEEIAVLRSGGENYYEEEFKNERALRTIQLLKAEQSCIDCHEGNVDDALAVISMRYSLEDDYSAIASQKFLAIAMLIAAILLAVSILVYVIKKYVVTNIINLTDSAQKIADGDLSVNLEVDSNDETKTLSDSLTRMVNSFKKNDAEMAEQKAIIEQKARETEEREKYLNECVNKMLNAMDKFAQGDLTVSLVCDSSNETITRLYTGFNNVVQNIKDMIRKLSEAVESTAETSSQISSSTEELAAGAQEQSMQASEVASSVEQMTRTILDNTHNAGEAAKKARESGEQARYGDEIVKETVAGMNQIAEVVNSAVEKVKELDNSTNQIGEIIQVIDEIADQTNLLALNAAIEAARAGDEGRGFAVVADEVRKLAERTSKATKQIAEMITHIQESTSGVVSSIQTGSDKAKEGSETAVKAGDSLNKIILSVHEVEEAINQVAAASEEQSTSSEQISRNIESISSVTHQTATGTEHIAHSAEDLNILIKNLNELVNKFSMDDTSEKRSKPASVKSSSSVRENGRVVSEY